MIHLQKSIYGNEQHMLLHLHLHLQWVKWVLECRECNASNALQPIPPKMTTYQNEKKSDKNWILDMI